MAIGIGTRLGVYEVVASIGAGGMGQVFRARDTRLGREVAIKVLRPDLTPTPERRLRFELEARAVSRLNHPGIVTLHGMDSVPGPEGTTDGVDFLVMELVPGESLHGRLRAGRLPLATVIDLGIQASDALAAAHAEGVVHRDLKPANLIVTPAGRLKILDFGLARFEQTAEPEALTFVEASPTETGTILGTVGYLSPEQARGERAHPRSDLFSLGVVLYEMLAGVAPFERGSALRSLSAVVNDPPPPLSQTPPDTPAALGALIGSCLEKHPSQRPQSAAAVADTLREIRAALTVAPDDRASRRRLWIGAAAASLLFIAGITGYWLSNADERWARETAFPTLEQLVRDEKLFDAFLLSNEIGRRLPAHPALARMLPEFSTPARIESEPSGAEVQLQAYGSPAARWYPLGPTPVDFQMPLQSVRMRLNMAGFDPIESAPSPAREDPSGRIIFQFRLDQAGTAPAGMVHVRGGTVVHRGAPVAVEDFWIDRLEVKNLDYQRFVDDGGYRRRDLWRHPIVVEGREMSWDDAMMQFRDATGRPGPATWELGRFPEGRGGLPVGGVSWFEAVAYAEWAGKTLPTYHQWFRAAQPDVFTEILSHSRIGGDGPVEAGSLPGLGPWGTLDMAGNVREWAWNSTGQFRFALGGAWSDPSYLFIEPEAFSPLRKTPDHGFRTMQPDGPVAAAALAALELSGVRDFTREPPVSDEVFAALAGVYSYNRTEPLAVTVESVDDRAPYWRLERVSIAAAYGGERLPVLLYLPKSAQPPLSAVLYLPESTAETLLSSENIATRWFEFLVRGGRAVVVPVYKNMYERRIAGGTFSVELRRDTVIAWSKDLGRTIDYLKTRQDIDSEKLAFYGFSLGAVYGPILAALEPRFQAVVLLGGGVNPGALPTEIDPIRFAPRLRTPTLMVAGREDFVRPLETAQRPLFALFGTPPDRKRLAVLEGGHLPPRMTDVMREVLAWLDRWLGPTG